MDTLSVNSCKIKINMINTSNYGQEKIVCKNTAHKFLRNEGDNTENSINLKFEHLPSPDQLKLQANTFARAFMKHGQFNHAKVLKVRDNEVLNTLSQMYIYSYFKALHDAWFNYNINKDSDLGWVFSGHSMMYHCITNPFNSVVKSGIHLGVEIDLKSEKNRRIKFTLLIRQFKEMEAFLNSNSSFGQRHFNIFDIEEKFCFYKTDFYATRAHGEPVENKNFKNSKPVINSENGSIEIVKLNDSGTAKIIEEKNFPLMNAFTDASSKKLFFIEPNSKHLIKDNASFFFSKAVFLNLASNYETTKLSERYYEVLGLTKEHDFFVTSEVYAMTGIKCSDYDVNAIDRTIPLGFKGLPMDVVLARIIGILSDSASFEEILIEIERIYREETEGKNKGK